MAEPAGALIEIGPVTRLAGITALRAVLLLTMKLVAGVPLKCTALVPVRF